jgi:hypothetical protein
MTGYQDFVKIYGSGIFIKSGEIKPKGLFQKALASLYIIPTIFRGIYYIPVDRERKGHFIQRRQDFFTSLFNKHYGRKKWYWSLSTAARHYGIEWSATKILEITCLGKSKTINLSNKIRSLEKKKSYRSSTLAKYLSSLEVNKIYIHKGKRRSFSSIKIDGIMGPICSREQLKKDIDQFISKIRDRKLKTIYKRILANLSV